MDKTTIIADQYGVGEFSHLNTTALSTSKIEEAIFVNSPLPLSTTKKVGEPGEDEDLFTINNLVTKAVAQNHLEDEELIVLLSTLHYIWNRIRFYEAPKIELAILIANISLRIGVRTPLTDAVLPYFKLFNSNLGLRIESQLKGY